MPDEADLILIGVATLVIAILIGVFMSPDRGGTGSGQRGGPGSRGGTIQGGGRMGSTTRRAGGGGGAILTPSKTLSPHALALQKELSLPYGSAVTITTNNTVMEWPLTGRGSPPRMIPQGVEWLKSLGEIADVFVINEVESDVAQTHALAALKANGLVDTEEGGTGIVEHKILFCSTSIGKQAIVRQVRPQLHVDFDSELISKLVPHVPRLVLVDPSFAGRADSVPYRVTSSLASLVPPAVAKMEAKVGTTGATTTIATSS